MQQVANSFILQQDPIAMKKGALAHFGKAVKHLLEQNSHLYKFMPLMKETKVQRLMRLVSDNCMESKDLDVDYSVSITRYLFPKFRVFSPTQKLMLVWFFFVFVAILYYYVEMGLVLTYGKNVWSDQLHSPAFVALDVITVMILILDVGVCINCGYLFRGMIVMERKRIVAEYFRKSFLIDLVSIIIVILCPVTGSYWLNYAKLWLILKIKRLFQIDSYYLRKLNIYRKNKAVYVIFKLIVIIFLLSHLVGLIFYAIDYYFLSTGFYDPSFCWLISSTAYSPIISLDYPLQYLYTLYWGVNTITTISYGDIAPLNPIENMYSILCFCFGFMVYGYVVNQIIQVILWTREDEDQFQTEMIMIDTYMHKMKISSELKRNIHSYLNFLHLEEKNRDLEIQAKMKQKIPEQLRIELLKNAYEIFYDKMLCIFKNTDIIKIFFHLNEKMFTHNEPILEQGERANFLFHLSKGKAEYFIEHGTTSTSIYVTQASNELMGHYEVFTRDRWPYSIRTTTSSLIYSINRLKLMEEVNLNSSLRERFKLIQTELVHKKKCLAVFYLCFFCNKEHYFNECPEKFPIFEVDLSLKSQQKAEKQPVRMIQQKCNTLRNAKSLRSFRQLQERENYKMIIKVEKRLAKIRRKIEIRNREFEVDTAYDWNIYEPQWNLSVLKELWNKNVLK